MHLMLNTNTTVSKAKILTTKLATTRLEAIFLTNNCGCPLHIQQLQVEKETRVLPYLCFLEERRGSSSVIDFN